MHEDASRDQDANTKTISAAAKAKQPQHRQETTTNEAQIGQGQRPGRSPSPSTAGPPLIDFDWADFEQRYLEALEEADGREQQIMDEFNQLVEVPRDPFLAHAQSRGQLTWTSSSLRHGRRHPQLMMTSELSKGLQRRYNRNSQTWPIADDKSRLRTRSRHVQLSEQTLEQKKKHCKFATLDAWRVMPNNAENGHMRVVSDVVEAFKSALALLSVR